MTITSKILDTKVNDGCLRIAFATSDQQTINEHFGWANCFLVYDVSKGGFSKVGKVEFEKTDKESECNPENKHFEKINALQSCHIVYSQSIGGPAAARLTQRKIHPLVAKNSPPIASILNDVKKLLNGTVPPWVRRLVKMEDPMRFESF
jgi:nitrogen fixation protein NifX